MKYEDDMWVYYENLLINYVSRAIIWPDTALSMSIFITCWCFWETGKYSWRPEPNLLSLSSGLLYSVSNLTFLVGLLLKIIDIPK
jgi:hypothetical protein